MTQKFGRNYRLTINLDDGGLPIIITMPFTLRFWLQRNTYASVNQISLDVINLSSSHRQRIYQDRFDYTPNRTIVFEAGYDTLYKVFQGRIYTANSQREGTEIVTRIEAKDGLFDISTSQTFVTLDAGRTVSDICKYLMGQFPEVKPGAVGNFSSVVQRPVVLNGATWDLLKQYSDGNVYIDNGRVYVLQQNEVLDMPVATIDSSTGLLGTPQRQDTIINVTTLLETGIQVKQLVNIASDVEKAYNGQYAVVGIMHQGTISAAVAPPCFSVFNLVAPNRLKEFVKVPSL